MPHLIGFLRPRLIGRMPRLDPFPCDGRIYTQEKLRRTVERLLGGREPSDAVIALTDVYTGADDFANAQDAKAKMRAWVGDEARFHPHAAQHDFEAWLLPYWDEIQRIAGHNRKAPKGAPESVNHGHPPSQHIKEMFEAGGGGRSYSKVRDANRILKNKDLNLTARQCGELKAFLNTILRLCGGERL